jgi:hypothetical protein
MSDHEIDDESDDLVELYDEVQPFDIECMSAQTAGGTSIDGGTVKLTDGYLAPSGGPLSLFIDPCADGSRRGLL